MPRTAERVPKPVAWIEIVSSRTPYSHPRPSGRRRRLCHRCHPRSSLLLLLLLLVGVEVGVVAMETAMGVEIRTDRVFHSRPTTTRPPVVFFPPPPPHLSRKYISLRTTRSPHPLSWLLLLHVIFTVCCGLWLVKSVVWPYPRSGRRWRRRGAGPGGGRRVLDGHDPRLLEKKRRRTV